MKKIIIGLLIAAAAAAAPAAQKCDAARALLREAGTLGLEARDLVRREFLCLRAIALCPSIPEAFNNLADVYEREGRFEEAIAQYRKALEAKPGFPYACYGLGDVYFKTGRYDEAVRWYSQGLESDRKPGERAPAAETALTEKRLALARDLAEQRVVKAETLRKLLTPEAPLPGVRGPGPIAPLVTFGENLIPFDFDNSEIRPDARPQIDELGKALVAILRGGGDAGAENRETAVFEVDGHTDSRGGDDYNLRLSERRAQSVIADLTARFNIPAGRLVPIGMGKRKPLCTRDDSEACHALNRRVEIIRRAESVVPVKIETRQFRPEGTLSAALPLALALDMACFVQKKDTGRIEPLENAVLRSKSDRYFFYIRPHQETYLYIFQEDSRGNRWRLFPAGNDGARVAAERDYWIPAFGGGFTLDESRGEERILVVSSATDWKAGTGQTPEEQVISIAVRSLLARPLTVRREEAAAPQPPALRISEPEWKSFSAYRERIEGMGGWVRIITFHHE